MTVEQLVRLREALAGRYTIERELGRGGMATVYLARDEKQCRPVAIKVLRPDLSPLLGPARFTREIEIASSLRHPNIVAVYDSGAAAGMLYYVMQYVAGETLREHLKAEKQLPLDETLVICREVADALAAAHTRGIVHRDIKPANILLAGGHALVADFGLARAIRTADSEQLTQSGIAVGTPAYMSPEQAGGQDEVDARSDVYSLGCVVYEMLAGEPPFSGSSTEALLARHRFDSVPPLRTVRPAVPPSVENAILHALEKVPADRFPSATAFAEALTAPGSERRRRSWLQGVAWGIAVMAVTLLVALLIRGSGPARQPQPSDLSRIAVLYFEDASPEGSLRWLARGLTEDLIDALGTVQGLTVTSRNGVRPYIGSTTAPDSIGRRLGVGLLVDGQVEPVGRVADSVRVSLRLVDAATAVLLDRLSLVRALRRPLELRMDLTGEMEQLLRRRIGARVRLRQERVTAGNDAAWEQFRRARELRNDARTLFEDGDQRGAASRLVRADSLLAVAERRAPDWLQPTIERADLALMEALVSPTGADSAYFGADRTTLLLRGARHAERALQRAPQDPPALAIHGEILLRLWNVGQLRSKDSLIPRAYRDLSQATELDPNLARAWYSLSEVLLARGEDEQSHLAAHKALTTDVYAAQAPAVITELFFSALGRDARAEADSLCQVGRRYYADNPNFIECELTSLGWFGRGAAAVREAWGIVQSLDTVSAVANGRLHRRLLVAAILARSGFPDSARSVIASTHALAPDAHTWADLALFEANVRVLLGERERALQLLRLVVAQAGQNREWLMRHPWFRSLREDPEFRRLTQQPR